MADEVVLDDARLKVTNFKKEIRIDDATGRELAEITFDFNVRGRDEFHDIAVLLYNDTFDVSVPKHGLAFKGKISRYSTSIPSFEDEHAVVSFSVGMIEIPS